MHTAIKIAERLFPQKRLVFIFDNSSAHNSLAKDALTVTKMNVGLGGKNTPDMHDTVIPADNPSGRAGRVQSMQFDINLPDDHPYKEFEGKPKGIKVILEERGLIPTTALGKRGGLKTKGWLASVKLAKRPRLGSRSSMCSVPKNWLPLMGTAEMTPTMRKNSGQQIVV